MPILRKAGWIKSPQHQTEHAGWFRLSGMTLGQAFTPPSALGPVIIAGDTVVRSWSFLVSASTLFIFELHSLWELSFGTLFFLVNILPCGCIFAPKWSLSLARKCASSPQIDHSMGTERDAVVEEQVISTLHQEWEANVPSKGCIVWPCRTRITQILPAIVGEWYSLCKFGRISKICHFREGMGEEDEKKNFRVFE